jgi:hypothetical protein
MIRGNQDPDDMSNIFNSRAGSEPSQSSKHEISEFDFNAEIMRFNPDIWDQNPNTLSRKSVQNFLGDNEPEQDVTPDQIKDRILYINKSLQNQGIKKLTDLSQINSLGCYDINRALDIILE